MLKLQRPLLRVDAMRCDVMRCDAMRCGSVSIADGGGCCVRACMFGGSGIACWAGRVDGMGRMSELIAACCWLLARCRRVPLLGIRSFYSIYVSIAARPTLPA